MVMLLAPKKTRAWSKPVAAHKHHRDKPEAGAAKTRQSLSRAKPPESTAVGSK